MSPVQRMRRHRKIREALKWCHQCTAPTPVYQGTRKCRRHLELAAKRAAKRRARLKEAGNKCLCGRPRAEGRKSCQGCLDYAARRRAGTLDTRPQ